MNGAQVEFIGNVVRDGFERMYGANSNTPYTRMSVAVNTWRRDQDKETEYFDVTLWGRQCETALERCGKGTQVFVRGRLSVRTYTKRDGTPGATPQVAVRELSVLNRAKGAPQAAAPEGEEDLHQETAGGAVPAAEPLEMDEDDFDDIPEYDTYG